MVSTLQQAECCLPVVGQLGPAPFGRAEGQGARTVQCNSLGLCGAVGDGVGKHGQTQAVQANAVEIVKVELSALP